MPNWCFTSYVVTGDSEEVHSLHKTLKELTERKESLLPNGFGKNWLGNVVASFGGDPKTVSCRGDWFDVELKQDDYGNDILSFRTETAWGRAEEVEDLVKSKLPSLSLWFLEEEPGMGIYQTNDADGTFFEDCIEIDFDGETEHFSKEGAVKKLSEILGEEFSSWEEAVKAVDKYNGEILENDPNDADIKWLGIKEPDIV